MSDDDDDVRRTLRAEADHYDPADDGWGAITGRVGAARRRRRVQGGVLGGLAAACVALVVAISVTGDGGTDVDATDGSTLATEGDAATSTTTTETTAPPTTAAPAPAPEDVTFPGIWPYASQEALAGPTDDRFLDPAATAEAFAREYVGMLDPAVDAPEPAGDGAVTVVVRQKGAADGEPIPGPGASVVTLRSFDTPGGATVWTVVGAAAASVLVDEPADGADVASPLAVRGQATGYEGTVIAEVRQDAMLAGEALGQEVGIAGSVGELGPLDLDVAFRAPSVRTGALLVTTDSGRDGVGVWEATVVRIAFAPAVGDGDTGGGGACVSPVPTALGVPDASMMVTFFHLCTTEVASDAGLESEDVFVEMTKVVPRSAGVLQASLQALLEGPHPSEEDFGFFSFFSTDTADLLRGVTIEGGTAIVDLDARLTTAANGASTSAGSVLFRGQLNRTVLQFPTVEAVEYRLDGSCDAFWQWQQVGDCQLVTRDDL